MKLIPLSKGFVAKVDDGDFDRVVAAGPWYANVRRDGRVYAMHTSGNGSKRVCRYLHRFVLDAGSGTEVDHESRDTLDCQRSNLRAATRSQNASNRGRMRSNTSGVVGVYWHKASGKWMARVSFQKKTYCLGVFESIDDAERVVREGRERIQGAFAPAGV